MAQNVSVTVVCDSKQKVGHKQGEHDALKTVRFSVEGQMREIDLCASEAERFEKQMAPWISSSRKAGGASNGNGGARRRRTAAARQEAGDIRQWARDHGIAISERGRIPAGVVAQYESAH